MFVFHNQSYNNLVRYIPSFLEAEVLEFRKIKGGNIKISHLNPSYLGGRDWYAHHSRVA
jgi:hypothetical protein